MNQNSESHRLKITSQRMYPDAKYVDAKYVTGTTVPHDESYIEIRGREGSKTIFKKRVSSLEDITDAQIQKLLGIAQRLPAVAFDALFDDQTIELMLNPDGKIWHEKLGESMRHICNMRESEADEFIRKIAGYLNKTIVWERPWLEGILPLDDSRFAGQIPPIVAHPSFTIRRRAVRVFTLDEYVVNGVMTAQQCKNLRFAIHDKQNILVLGGTGSGKTTLGNAILNEITLLEPDARQIILEDTAELNSTALNKVNLQTTEECSMNDLLKIALRMRPDRIIVGEVRGGEAFALVQAWNTGHGGGLATLHANDCASGLRRLKSMISQHPDAPEDIEPDILVAVNVMVNIVKSGTGRRVREIVSVKEYDPNQRQNNGFHLEPL